MAGKSLTPIKSSNEIIVKIQTDVDVVIARQEGRRLAAEIGLSSADQTLVATAISEVARNIVNYAQSGQIILAFIDSNGRRGISIIAKDSGPGIPDINLAMQDGYSTSRGLGLGLPGSKRIVDEFDISSEVGKGTVITMRKWKN